MPPDRAQAGAAVIAAASGLSVAVVTLAGGLLTAFRTQGVAGRLALLNERREAYSKFLAASDRYISAAAAYHDAAARRDEADRVAAAIGNRAGESDDEDKRDKLAKQLEVANSTYQEEVIAVETRDSERGLAASEVRETLSLAVLLASKRCATVLIDYGDSVLGERDDRISRRNVVYRDLRSELGLPKRDL